MWPIKTAPTSAYSADIRKVKLLSLLKVSRVYPVVFKLRRRCRLRYWNELFNKCLLTLVAEIGKLVFDVRSVSAVVAAFIYAYWAQLALLQSLFPRILSLKHQIIFRQTRIAWYTASPRPVRACTCSLYNPRLRINPLNKAVFSFSIDQILEPKVSIQAVLRQVIHHERIWWIDNFLITWLVLVIASFYPVSDRALAHKVVNETFIHLILRVLVIVGRESLYLLQILLVVVLYC